MDNSIRLTYIGGPTALLEIGGLRLLTDPTFDPAGTDYPTPVYVLRKTMGPAIAEESIGRIDAVLLSHDHHFDNFDHGGRRVADAASLIVTTAAGAGRLGGRAHGLDPWARHDLQMPDGGSLRVTATPARHGPPGGDRGPVVGFVLQTVPGHGPAIYVSGDTVWFEGVSEVAERFEVDLVLLFAGAARVREVGPAHLTFTAEEAVQAARVFGTAAIVPLHFEGWTHFSESRADLVRAFSTAGLESRLLWPAAGHAIALPF